MAAAIRMDEIRTLFQQEVSGLQDEPEFQFSARRVGYALDGDGAPDVQVAVANVPLDYDLWKGLRNPAVIGLHPAGLREIWDYYACTTARGTDAEGRSTMFRIPQTYEAAQERFRRAVLISVMLPFSGETLEAYARTIVDDSPASLHRINQTYHHTDGSLDRATIRVAMSLVARGRVVVAMDNATVKRISAETIPATRQGEAHGPSKGGNWSQKSIAVLTGLGQFGVARFVVRDEVVGGRVKRHVGPLRSIVIFDDHDLMTDGSGGIICISDAWRSFLMRLYDFTDTDPEIERYRLCSYLSPAGDGCQACLQSCRQGALANSMPGPSGRYPDRIEVQGHRFWDGQLQFDHARHREEINHMRALYPEWECMRCVAVCAARGGRSTDCLADFQRKMAELNAC